MSKKNVYALLTLLGLVLPLSQFVPWLAGHGLDPAAFVADLFANRVSAFFGLDVILSAVVLLVHIGTEHRRTAGLRHWWIPVAGTVLIGVSFGLPLFLYLREASGTAPEARVR